MAQGNIVFRQLGKDGPTGTPEEVLSLLPPSNTILAVSALGFGAMGLSAFYGTIPTDEENHKLIKLASAVTHLCASICDSALQAVDLGASFIDTADVGGFPNEALRPGSYLAQCYGPPMVSQDSIRASTS